MRQSNIVTRRDVTWGYSRARNCRAALDSLVATAADYPPSNASWVRASSRNGRDFLFLLSFVVVGPIVAVVGVLHPFSRVLRERTVFLVLYSFGLVLSLLRATASSVTLIVYLFCLSIRWLDRLNVEEAAIVTLILDCAATTIEQEQEERSPFIAINKTPPIWSKRAAAAASAAPPKD